jgi:uncharacterized membrane protein (DUF4010 family)
VTLTFARSSRAMSGMDKELAFGTIAANAVLYPRVLIATLILNPMVLGPLARYLAAPALVAALITIAGIRRSPPSGAPDLPQRNPLQLTGALQMVLLFQMVLFAVRFLGNVWGDTGVFSTAGVLGVMDVDALTLSMTKGASDALSPRVAAMAIAVGVMTNTAMKLALAVVLGSSTFRLMAGTALLLMLLALLAAWIPAWG